MATCLFRSSLAFRLQTFLETRRAAGRDDVATQKILIYLDRFLMAEAAKASPRLLTRNVTSAYYLPFATPRRCICYSPTSISI